MLPLLCGNHFANNVPFPAQILHYCYRVLFSLCVLVRKKERRECRDIVDGGILFFSLSHSNASSGSVVARSLYPARTARSAHTGHFNPFHSGFDNCFVFVPADATAPPHIFRRFLVYRIMCDGSVPVRPCRFFCQTRNPGSCYISTTRVSIIGR